jgi:hypothetical protein
MHWINDSDEQGGSTVKKSNSGKENMSDRFDLFNNLDQNINEYQIEKNEFSGTISVKIGTSYTKSAAPLHNAKSPVF